MTVTEHRVKLVTLRAVMAAAAVNIWTGAPLLGIWVGSRVATARSEVTMGIVFLIVVVIAVACGALVWLLSWASAVHDELTGRPPAARRQAPWLRSMRAERAEWERVHVRPTTLDRILVGCVVVAVVAFETWFFFFSPSPI